MSKEFLTREEELERKVEERTRELTTLLYVTRNINTTLELEPLLGLILDQLKNVVDYDSASINQLEEGMLQAVAARNRLPSQELRRIRYPVDSVIDQEVIGTRKPFLLPDIHGETADAKYFRDLYTKNSEKLFGDKAQSVVNTLYGNVHTWLRVPLIVNDQVIGMLTLSHREKAYYTPRQVELVVAFADQAAVAIENARLFETVEKRTSELSSLLNVTRSLVSTLELKPLLTLILKNLKQVIDYTGAAIAVLEGNEMVVLDYNGPKDRETMLGVRIPLSRESGYKEVLRRKEPVIIGDMWSDDPWLEKVRADNLDIMRGRFEYAHSWLGVPLMTKNEFLGVLRLDHNEPNYFVELQAELALAFAYQAATAIENARLYEQARQLAALEERQKLARELHDSVSQALYGIVLGARTARTLLERDPSRIGEPLEYISTLAEAGLAEMRALIFELRPESLQSEGLVVALTKQIKALRARHQLVVDAVLCPEPEVSLEIKEVLYRVAQEALHNIVKHARASHVEIQLETGTNTLSLFIHDDGMGFDPSGEFPGHLGLLSMRERVEKVKGSFRIESSPGKGTVIQVEIIS